MDADVLECSFCGSPLCYVYSAKHGDQRGINRVVAFCNDKCEGKAEWARSISHGQQLQGEYVRDGQWCVLVVTREDIAQHVEEDSDYVGINPQKLAESLSMDEMRFLTARLGEYLLQDWRQSLGMALQDVLERRPVKKPAKR